MFELHLQSFKMSDRDLKNEMRYAVQFCRQLGKSIPETVKMMKEAYKENFLGESTIF